MDPICPTDLQDDARDSGSVAGMTMSESMTAWFL